MRVSDIIELGLGLSLAVGPVIGEELYFGKPLTKKMEQKKEFWKIPYSELDSNHVIFFHDRTLEKYAICHKDEADKKEKELKKKMKNPKRLRRKIGRKEFIKEAVLRSKEFPFIKDTLAAAKLNPDFKWLPVLESGYMNLVSTANARGIWQFIPSTGKRFGLNKLEDVEDPKKATSAFRKYMTFLLKDFKGDAPLAITAYNHGEKGVKNKLIRSGGKDLEDILGLLGFQSRNYYAKFLSIIDIADRIREEQVWDSLETVYEEMDKKKYHIEPKTKFVKNAQKYLGYPYVWDGRDTKKFPGIDCMGIIFRAYAATTGKEWSKLSVYPSKLVKNGKLGKGVKGLMGVFKKDIDYSKLKEGDIVYLMVTKEIKDKPLMINGVKYWPWHMGIYEGGPDHLLLHAGDQKVIEEPLENLLYTDKDAIYVTRPDFIQKKQAGSLTSRSDR